MNDFDTDIRYWIREYIKYVKENIVDTYQIIPIYFNGKEEQYYVYIIAKEDYIMKIPQIVLYDYIRRHNDN